MIVTSLFFVISACEKTVEINDPSFNPQLVIVSNIAPQYTNFPGDNRVRVEVSQSQQPDDNQDFTNPEGVEVFLGDSDYNGVQKLEKLSNQNFYSSQRDFIKPEKKYDLEVIADGFDTIHAQTYIPRASQVLNYKIVDFVADPSERNEEKINIRYTIEFEIDHKIEIEYYHIAFFNEYWDDDPTTLDDERWWVMDPIYEDDRLYTPHFEYGVLIRKSDIPVGHVFRFEVSDYIFEHEKVENHWMELRSLTEEYYLYHESLSRQKLVRQDPFAEPVIIYNNIENGLGNFAGYNSDVIGLPQPE